MTLETLMKKDLALEISAALEELKKTVNRLDEKQRLRRERNNGHKP